MIQETRKRSMRDALDALDWVRREIVRMHAPDQVRQRKREAWVRTICEKLVRGSANPRFGRRP